MIARHEAQTEQADVWARLAAPLPPGVIFWRQDGRPVARDGKFFARFVSYVEANTVRERLDAAVPGEWNLTLELLPPLPHADDSSDTAPCAFKARLQILGVVREDVGTGKDYKQAATDAFKRVAVRFGIAHELYAMEQNWVAVDGDGKYAKPLEDPAVAYARRYGVATGPALAAAAPAEDAEAAAASAANGKVKSLRAAITSDVPPCPKCGGRMWDNRIGKRNPKAPDFKCRDRSCDGVIWPPKPGANKSAADAEPATEPAEPIALSSGTDDIPF